MGWSIGKSRREKIYKRCKKEFGRGFQLKFLRQSLLEDDDIAPIDTPYFSYKISLSEIPLDEVIQSLPRIVSPKVILHDIDIAQDMPYITTRKDVRKFVLEEGLVEENNIVGDRRQLHIIL